MLYVPLTFAVPVLYGYSPTAIVSNMSLVTISLPSMAAATLVLEKYKLVVPSGKLSVVLPAKLPMS